MDVLYLQRSNNMANSVQILDKIARNLNKLGVSAVRGSSSVSAGGLTVSYVSASVQSPMGGIDKDASPFLGIGVAAPGKIKIKGAAGENSLAAVLDTAAAANVLAVCCRFANNVQIEAGDSSTLLAELAGHADVLMVGE
jgi:hypothetical protein